MAQTEKHRAMEIRRNRENGTSALIGVGVKGWMLELRVELLKVLERER